ncbi:uncharacterized protein [Nicotiana tomentosiformis]|uniref:uncharacterized protein isoform X1 n=1 Tax=Nicotiana tomentosiformis TaxID=4098 RepID=UPI00051ACDF5|nr:uncharacterized protein LOC104106266 isoform X1 [Nicotiana tomentosiformis]XP_033514582.1 uncharacterized protein LOC104106266 isoform X1 [Nicotiana tomentosiformis]XP_033514583.1 uncharacterized protein LOC104106266 isoform X1 [Nicotiana tomentosiformis]
MESKFLSSIAPAPSPTLSTFPVSSDEATNRTIQSPAAKSPAPPTTPSTPLSTQDIRRWRPAAQRNLRNQWSKLAALRTQWFSLSSTARSYATSVVNSHLSQRYMDAMDLGVLTDMPDIRKKACRKLFKQQVIIETYRSNLLSSYKDMVAVVTQMVNVSKSMRCYRKGTNGSALTEFSLFPGDQNDTGDGDGIPVFTFWSIFDFEKLALELVQMFVSETNIKRLLVMEICSIGSEEFSQVDRLKWSDHFYVGEFDDLLKCNSNSNEVLKQLVPRLESCNSRTSPMQSSNQLESNILQVYLTTWLAEVNVDRFRIGELFAMVGEEMHVTIS